MANRLSPRAVIMPLLPLAALVLFWELAAQQARSVRFFYGQPSSIVAALLEDVSQHGLMYDVWLTISAATLGLLVGTILGFLLSLAITSMKVLEEVFVPYLAFLGAVPIVAIAPMTILWFGAGFESKVAIAALSTLIIATAQAVQAIQNTNVEWSQLGKIFGASRWRLYRHIVVPEALVWVFGSWKVAIGLALIGTFVAEFVSADRGLGRYILKSGALYDSSRVVLGVLILGVAALLLTAAIDRLEKFLMPWRALRSSEGFARQQENS